ncbi:MAG: DUF1549 domain-containing protein [Planctomycetales bacterium]|nr:DUF1549 domain-containing protein [Planctomycetales bacterium]
MQRNLFPSLVFSAMVISSVPLLAAELPSVEKRFADASVSETPDFQRHVVPLMGRLGCNGRSCHGSFQGRGGFQLSLFGYDFRADHAALTEGDEPRVSVKEPMDSMILNKPTDEFEHEGGKRFERDSWQYHVFRRWVEAGAKYDAESAQALVALEVTPAEIQFHKDQEQVALQAVAVWDDGTREDVTPLCRFQSNDDAVVAVDETGLVTSGEKGDSHVVVFYDNAVVPVPIMRPVSDQIDQAYPDVATSTKVDELIVAKLRKMGIVPSDLCTDAEFLRRMSLDLTGTLPSASEIEAFLADSAQDKRAQKVDELLESPAYAAWWATRFCDYTGNNSDALNNVTPVREMAGQAWYDWIYDRIARNVPYDEIVAGIVLSESREGDESYREYCEAMSDICRADEQRPFAERETMPYYWARRTIRQPEDRAIAFAYTFMGIRIECAQCHKHPFDQWSKNDFEQFTGFFSRITLGNNGLGNDAKAQYQEMVAELGIEGKRGGELRKSFSQLIEKGKTVPFPEVAVTGAKATYNKKDKKQGKEAPARKTARLLDGQVIDVASVDDPRKPLMDWLRSGDNPYLARAIVNRIWANYFNVGIVQPTDDLSLAHPPSNAPLLDYLAREFVAHGYDLKWLHREIIASDAYQRSWRPNETNMHDEKNFSRAIPRRLPAEVAYDVLRQALVNDEQAAVARDDLKGRAIAIATAGARNNSRGPQYALTVFGRSIRESNCDCDRTNDASLLQTVYIQNDSDTLMLLDDRDSWVAQVSKELGLSKSAKQKTPPRPKNYDTVIENLEKQVQRHHRRGDDAAERKAKVALKAYRERFQDSSDEAGEETAAEWNVDALIERAYLRTLSRRPTTDELAASADFLRESEDRVEGLKGLLWALVNTKEFIVNH